MAGEVLLVARLEDGQPEVMTLALTLTLTPTLTLTWKMSSLRSVTLIPPLPLTVICAPPLERRERRVPPPSAGGGGPPG